MWNIIDNDGQVLSRFSAEEDARVNTRNGQECVWLDKAADWVEQGVGFLRPEQPSLHHVFNYTTKQWEDPRTPETEWPVVRAQRNALLSASDWTQLPDVPLATKEAWAAYRQALRDVTLQIDPFAIDWPVAPGS
jgi:hypothetical protein